MSEPKHALNTDTNNNKNEDTNNNPNDNTNIGAATAFKNRAWLQHYNDACPPEIDFADLTLVDNYVENLKITGIAMPPGFSDNRRRMRNLISRSAR